MLAYVYLRYSSDYERKDKENKTKITASKDSRGTQMSTKTFTYHMLESPRRRFFDTVYQLLPIIRPRLGRIPRR